MPIKNNATIPGASLASTIRVLAGLGPNLRFIQFIKRYVCSCFLDVLLDLNNIKK